jgi:hypothetical protein
MTLRALRRNSICFPAMLLRLMSAARKPTPDSTTAAEIVATIPAPPDLAVLEQRLAVLRTSRDSIRTMIDTTNALKVPPSFFVGARKQKIETEREIVVVRQDHSALRAAHETSVRAALEPMRTEAVARFDAAFAELIEAWGTLDEIATENGKIAVKNGAPRMKAIQFRQVVTGFVEGAKL